MPLRENGHGRNERIPATAHEIQKLQKFFFTQNTPEENMELHNLVDTIGLAVNEKTFSDDPNNTK